MYIMFFLIEQQKWPKFWEAFKIEAMQGKMPVPLTLFLAWLIHKNINVTGIPCMLKLIMSSLSLPFMKKIKASWIGRNLNIPKTEHLPANAKNDNAFLAISWKIQTAPLEVRINPICRYFMQQAAIPPGICRRGWNCTHSNLKTCPTWNPSSPSSIRLMYFRIHLPNKSELKFPTIRINQIQVCRACPVYICLFRVLILWANIRERWQMEATLPGPCFNRCQGLFCGHINYLSPGQAWSSSLSYCLVWGNLGRFAKILKRE